MKLKLRLRQSKLERKREKRLKKKKFSNLEDLESSDVDLDEDLDDVDSQEDGGYYPENQEP